MQQIGRAADGAAPTIHYGQAKLNGTIHGGVIDVGGHRETIVATESAVVWPSPDRVRQALVPSGDFERAYEASRRRRGHVRTANALIREGDQVWVSNEGFVSAVEPRRWLARQRSRLVLFAVACIVLAAVSTGLALWPPVFGLASKVGAFSGLVFFLLVQPAGTAVRDMTLPPHRAVHRTVWTTDAASSGSASSSAPGVAQA
jgi:hypothetical protein